MKKVSALVVALIAMLAFGGIAADAAKKKVKVTSKISLQFDRGPSTYPDGYYEEAVFKGRVKSTKVKGAQGKKKRAAKRKCIKRRTVVIKQVGGGTFGQTKTNARGRYRMSASDAYNQPGEYFAKVKKKKKGRIICKPARSQPVLAF